jgi:hypothetical protein
MKSLFYRVHAKSNSHNADLAYQSYTVVINDILPELMNSTALSKSEKTALRTQIRKSHSYHSLKYAHILLAHGRIQDARSMMTKSFSLNPINFRSWWGVIKSRLACHNFN